MMSSIGISPAKRGISGERVRHFTAHAEIFRRLTACPPVTKDVVLQPSVAAQVKPAQTPVKDKVRAMRELLLF
jgi:negative regulator of replication initiation